MLYRLSLSICSLCTFLLGASFVLAQAEPRGLLLNGDNAFSGFTLFAPLGNKYTHLINMSGEVVHSWESKHSPANSAFILPNGDLLRCAKKTDNKLFGNSGPSGGRVERFSWDGELLWDYVFSDDTQHHHHDIEPLPNGNVLLIAWHFVSKEDAIAAGRNPSAIDEKGIFPDKVVEIKQTGMTTGEVVWEWNTWDHLIQDFDESKENFGVIAEHPELVDVNIAPRPRTDWMHSNGVAYNAELDQIILSVRSFGEFFVIDHSTTTEEAKGHAGGRAGKGGDILYRWGNPENYDAGGPEDRKLFGQHDARWVDAGFPGEGNITIFNNGSARPGGEYSSVDEIIPPIKKDGTYELGEGKAFGPSSVEWSYSAENKKDFYSWFISGAERLPNGNTLICAGAMGEVFEVTPGKEVVWKYLNPFGSNDGPPGKASEQSKNNAKPTKADAAKPNEQSSKPDSTTPSKPATQNAGRQRRGGRTASPYIVFRVERYTPDFPAFQGKGLELISE